MCSIFAFVEWLFGMLWLGFIQYLAVWSNHSFVHGVSHFGLDFGRGEKHAYQIHFENGTFVFLWEIIIDTMLFIETMVSFHHALHLINQISENLHSADAKEVGWSGSRMLKGVNESIRHIINCPVRIKLISSHANQDIAAYLSTAFQNHLEIGFFGIVTTD